MADKPVTREEKYLAYLAGDYTGEIPKPITRKEKYLYELCLKGMGGEISPEEIKNAVNEYLEKNPVKPGATTEQAQQIEQNKTDIASLKVETDSIKEDISNKITKFYASNQGETHLADSDNGKIMDMMIYGKSEQFTTTGKNLLKIKDGVQTMRGVTVTAKDGVVALKGTATEAGWVTLDTDSFMLDGTYILSSNITTMQVRVANKLNKEVLKQNKSATLENEEVSKVAFPVTGGKTYDVSNILVQIEKGSVATSYEPYTGGQPSPSPDYPQEIKSVVNPTVKVCGKNFYSGSDLIGLTKPYVTDFIPVILHKGEVRISFDAFSDTSNGNYLISVQYFDANKERIGNNGSANEIGNNISHVSLKFDGGNAGGNKGGINLKNVLYVKISFGIYDNTATEITYKNIMISATNSDFEPYKPIQTITLPYALNAIPVNSGGNVTIDGQQYIADYVDVERGKIVRMCEKTTFNTKNGVINEEYRLAIDVDIAAQNDGSKECIFSAFEWTGWGTCAAGTKIYIKNIKKSNSELYTAQELKELGLDFDAIYQLAEKQEIDLTTEQITAFKELVTYYPVTNISVNSEQLDGYTIFNYPISMANGWNYVKKQLNDNRDYIYDMDLQSAEAYVNSEYAVALTELEV